MVTTPSPLALHISTLLAANGIMEDRARLAAQFGQQFGGARDLYEAAGYPKDISFDQYLARYVRQGIARRIVNAGPDDTWRTPPDIMDTEKEKKSPFEEAIRRLVEGGATEDGERRQGLYYYLHKLDRLAGVGRFAVLMFGLAGNTPLEQPVKAGSLKAPEDLLYFNAFAEGAVEIMAYEKNTASRRYGRPTIYKLTTTQGDSEVNLMVHWTRVLHVAQESLGNDLIGTPRLEAAWNDLMNVEKVMAAAGEAGWDAMKPGYVITTRDGYRLPVADDALPDDQKAAVEAAIKAQQEQIDAYIHGLRRWLQLEGMDVKSMAQALGDPTGVLNACLRLISAATGMPVRILTGSERGELASVQDDDNWAATVASRQTQIVEPLILRPAIDRLIWYGVLPQPVDGRYRVVWPPVKERNKGEGAAVAGAVAQALKTIEAVIDPPIFLETYLPELPKKAVKSLEEIQAEIAKQQAAQMAAVGAQAAPGAPPGASPVQPTAAGQENATTPAQGAPVANQQEGDAALPAARFHRSRFDY